MKKYKKVKQRITKIKPYVDKCNWEGINYPSEKACWKKNWKNNLTIALNDFYAKNDKIYPAYVSKHNSKCIKEGNPLMIPNKEGCHYIPVKKY